MGKKAKERKRERKAQALQATAPAPSNEVLEGGQALSDGSIEGAADGGAATTGAEMSGQLATRLNSVAIHLLRRLQREDTKLGLSGARLSALSVLVFGGPRTLGKLADAEGVSPPSMTRLVTAMEAEGLVAREKNSADGRSVIIRASAEGERILLRGRELRVEALAGWLAELSPAGLASLDDATTTLESLLRSQRSDRTEAPKPDRTT